MLVDIRAESLRRAMEYVGVMELPSLYIDSDVVDGWWLDSLVLVRKYGGSESWCVCHHGCDGVIRWVRDFGLCRPIWGILGIYPYRYLDVVTYGLRCSGIESRREYVRKFFSSLANLSFYPSYLSRVYLDRMNDDDVEILDRLRIEIEMRRASLLVGGIIHEEVQSDDWFRASELLSVSVGVGSCVRSSVSGRLLSLSASSDVSD